jgi:hypothetical protein
LTEAKQRFEAESQSRLREDAKTCLAIVRKEIPNWNDALYGDILAYGKSNGANEAYLKNLVDPVAIKILHKAMMYDRSRNVKTTPVNHSREMKVIKSDVNSETTRKATRPSKNEAQWRRAKETGSVDDIGELFAADL